jgi:molybdate transport system regulatory protein
VALLEQIRANGSISAAARAMGMSYRHAWELIDSMNRQLGVPLVIKATGGRGGGGTRLTATAEQAIATFHELDGAFREFMKQRTQLLSLETAPINDNQETGLE